MLNKKQLTETCANYCNPTRNILTENKAVLRIDYTKVVDKALMKNALVRN